MAYNVDVYAGNENKPHAQIRQSGVRRDWMDGPGGIYHCRPVTFANTMSYEIYFDEDISFIWDGDNVHPAKSTNENNFVWSGRELGTVSFDLNLMVKTDENTSILTFPTPNYYIKDAMTITTLLSSSFFTGPFHVVWKLFVPNKEYFIPAGTPVGSFMPISVEPLHNSTVRVHEKEYSGYRLHHDPEYVDEIHRIVWSGGKNPEFYKNGTDHKGNLIGKHEVSKLRLNVEHIFDLKDGEND